jgi:hypothetical protein
MGAFIGTTSLGYHLTARALDGTTVIDKDMKSSGAQGQRQSQRDEDDEHVDCQRPQESPGAPQGSDVLRGDDGYNGRDAFIDQGAVKDGALTEVCEVIVEALPLSVK